MEKIKIKCKEWWVSPIKPTLILIKQFLIKYSKLLLEDIKRYKRAFFMSFLVALLGFSCCYQYNVYQKALNGAREAVTESIDAWTSQDLERLANAFNTSEDNFLIDTGVGNDDVNTIFQDLVYSNKAVYEIKNVSMDYQKENAEVRVLIKTYDSLTEFKEFLQGIVDDKTPITYKYSQTDFINKHIENLKTTIKDLDTAYSDVQVLKLHYNDETEAWEMQYEENYDVLNSMSSNMFQLRDELTTNTEE